MRSIYIILGLIINLWVNKTIAQTQIFLSPNGADVGNGTIAKPLKTLAYALKYSEKLVNKDVVFNLRAGTYFLDKTLVISTKNNKSLTIEGYQNEVAIISGGKSILTKWERYKGQIYKTDVPKGSAFEMMFVNGKQQVLARYPNFDKNKKPFNGVATDALSVERTKRYKNPIGAYVHGLQVSSWGSLHYVVIGVDDNGLKMEGGWQNNRPSTLKKTGAFIENVFEELDVPGEWFLDKENNVLYFYPPNKTDLAKNIIVSNLKNSIEVRGTANKPVKNIHFKNLSFNHNERSFMDTREPLLRSDWTFYRGAALLFDGSENCTVSNSNFYNLGGNAILLSNYNKNNAISGNYIREIGASAICFVGDAKAVRSPTFRYEDFVSYDLMDKTPGPLTNNYPQKCSANDNLIHDIGLLEKQATGVEIEIASEITVSHNSIYNTPRAGINIGDGCFGGHIISYNDVFNTVLETGDHGAFNSWGRDRFWAANREYMDSLVSKHPELILLDAQKQIVIHNNRFRCDHGWDVDLDDGSSNYLIYNNVLLNGGLKFREGFYRIAKNNIILNNGFHPHVWFKNSGDVFENNIVMTDYAPIGIKYWGKSIDKNLFPNRATLQNAQAQGIDAKSLFGKPDFLAPEKGDYTVSENSKALKIGFKNFAQNQFGVSSAKLKALAAQPVIPVLQYAVEGDKSSAIVDFNRSQVKSVESLAERSAYGLPDESGVIVIAVGANTMLQKSGVLDKDVIVSFFGKPVKDVKSLQEIYAQSALNSQIHKEIIIIRNQQLIRENIIL